jgi:soluble lytic murein transglycosylase
MPHRFSSRTTVSSSLVLMCALMLGGPLVPGLFAALSFATEPESTNAVVPFLCETAEDCFHAAVATTKQKSTTPTGREQLAILKLERLRLVMERQPASLWARRAGLLSGVLLVDRDPAMAIKFLRAAQRDFPVLEDYVRLWMGEALLKQGDAARAAAMIESIPQAVPDTNLSSRVAYLAGEAWYQAGDCISAAEWLSRATVSNEKDLSAPSALMRLAVCYAREGRHTEGSTFLKQIWIRYPNSPEAREAETRLNGNPNGEAWIPSPDDRYARAQAYLGLALHAEAIDELRKFLTAAPHHPRRLEAKLKLGVAHVRLKAYDQAREVFLGLVGNGASEANEAVVWLARIYLRQGEGDNLLELAQSSVQPLTDEQRAMVQLFAGMWLEDEHKFEEAIVRFRQVVSSEAPPPQRLEGLWRMGWVQYRINRYSEAMVTFQEVVDAKDGDWEPQALYWMGRATERESRDRANDLYGRLCQRYIYTYYCQLSRERAEIPAPPVTMVESEQEPTVGLPLNKRREVERESAYQRAIELKFLGLDQDAARELAALTGRYGRDQDVMLTLSTLLNEVGAYHQALRLARLHFREKLERSGGSVAPSLWNVAYPTGLVPSIRAQDVKRVDPYLAAAIIREESQYDSRALSRVGAIGLMQVMPATANAVAHRWGLPAVSRDDLFDQETNIRIGVRYLEELLAQFSGNFIATIGAYNAGPQVVQKWLAMNLGREPDEFVELIPYQETRQYVKRVLRSYREYVRLGKHSP